jgi:hypothetical protein
MKMPDFLSIFELFLVMNQMVMSQFPPPEVVRFLMAKKKEHEGRRRKGRSLVDT